MTAWIAPLFALTALLYALAGFGGGSTYAAILALTELDYALLPILVLVCNVVVVCGGVTQYLRAGLIDFRFVLPLVFASVPCALAGGALTISRQYFLLTLGAALLVSGLLLVWRQNDTAHDPVRPANWWLKASLLGGSLGFLSGLVGIGGGIFLAPILHHLKWTTPKRIAATASFFILLNSLAGLLGQLSKHAPGTLTLERFGLFAWLPLAVLVGGLVGSRLSATWLSGRAVKVLTGLLVILVGLRLLWQNGRGML